MNRRDTFKTLFVGAIAGVTIGTAPGCKPEEKATVQQLPDYGRTPDEKERDQRILAEQFLNEHELATIGVLCDIILPAQPNKQNAATDAGVVEFIDFIVKDIESHQLKVRGGLMWLDGEANKRFGKVFKDCSNAEQIKIVDDIAYPDPDGEKPDMAAGIKFFDLMRGLTLTGFYTSRMGIEELGYVGNRPNVWDGVPEDVLKKHGMAYEKEWIAKCVDQEKRMVIAEWDDNMNLIT